MSYEQIDKIDVAIAGGGIVGLWCAYEILSRKPHLSVAVFEKESFLGEHTSGRNSEVLHAGLYYETGSLKHLTCLEGNRLWRSFFQKYQLDFLDCGKFIVSPEENSEELANLLFRGETNNVPSLRWASHKEVSDLSPWVNCRSGLFSPSSGVINASGAIKLLEHLIESLGGMIIKRSEISVLETNTQGFLLKCGNDIFRSDLLINTAGHQSVDLRGQLGLQGFSKKMVKGSYLTLKRKLGVKSLIYPVPPKHGLGLGTHLTLDCAWEQKFGPDTELVEKLDYSLDESVVERMFPAIHNLFPTVKKEELNLGYAGIRPRIVNPQGELVRDFIFNSPQHSGIPGYYEFLGIESPGLTAAPSLAKRLADSLF